MPEPLMEGYKELWGAVLLKAIDDALCECPSSTEMINAKRDAIEWFNNPDENFALVCTFAGFDPVAVYQAWKGKRIRHIGPQRAMPKKQDASSRKSQPPNTWQQNGTDEEIRAKARAILSQGWATKNEVRKALSVGRARASEVMASLSKSLEMRRGEKNRIEYRLTEQREAAE